MTCSEVWALHKWHATNSSCFKMPLFSSHIVPQGAIKSSLKIKKIIMKWILQIISLFFYSISTFPIPWISGSIGKSMESPHQPEDILHRVNRNLKKTNLKHIKILILKSYISAPNCRSGRVDPHFPTSTVPEIALEPLDSDPHLGGFLRMWRMNRG